LNIPGSSCSTGQDKKMITFNYTSISFLNETSEKMREISKQNADGVLYGFSLFRISTKYVILISDFFTQTRIRNIMISL